MDTIKAELRRLPSEERRKLLAFLIMLEDESRSGYAAEMARRIDNSSSEHWVSPEECERELGL